MPSQVMDGVMSIRVGAQSRSFKSDGKNLGIRLAQDFIGRADDLLIDAAGSTDPGERFVYSYLAALRGAGAVLAVMERRVRHSGSRSAWVRMRTVSPEFTQWATYFAQHSVTRAAVEAGITARVDAVLANQLYLKAGEFLDAVDDVVECLASDGRVKIGGRKEDQKSA
ncbi:MAG: SAV_6107 family HEPN domain-containing protein [Mycobacteriaceae bacterium]